MNITEHEMRGLLAGKCIPADILVNETLPSYLVRKFFEEEDKLRIKQNHITLRDTYIAELEGSVEGLQQKLDAVLAENVALKNYLQECSVVQGEGNWTSDAEKSVYVPATEWLPPTPSTDALLNAVRAEAIEQAAEKAPWLYGDQMGRSVEAIPKEQLIKWAAQLRAETDTTPSQYESLAGGK